MNENGYPVREVTEAPEKSADTPRSTVNTRNLTEGVDYEADGCNGDCPKNCLLAYVYAPTQKFRMLYSAQDALTHGTLFEELYKPMGVYGNE